MIIKLKKDLAASIGFEEFEAFGLGENSWDYTKVGEIDLAVLTAKKIMALDALFEIHTDVRGVKVIRRDIKTWLAAVNDASSTKPRTVRQFEILLTQFILKANGHRIFCRFGNDQWLCYYVNEIEYIPAQKHNYSTTPEHVNMYIVWDKFGGRNTNRITFYNDDCINLSISEALIRKGFVAETSELRTSYLDEMEKFSDITARIGEQFWCTGTGTDDLDGNPDRNDSWWSRRTNTIQMVRSGSPARVVVDVFYEDDSSDRENTKVHLKRFFWRGKKVSDEEEECEEVEEEIEIPIHPFCAVFDLSKHLRLQVHVNYLKPYIYDKDLSNKLIIPDDLRSLVHILIEHKDGGFKDIVRGKAGGAVVLLCGRPGVGKTLTAEVYAESESRALYSVQCSQLGTDPQELEDELLKVFARAARWNAVMLLDEADVYVRTRGEDLNQNAIVGVFLRVLEYQSSVLFLTTNRPDDVDDAIASRCIAKIEYRLPNAEDQRRIWRVLADGSGVNLSSGAIDEIVRQNPGLSGRDVKNLLKLASLIRSGKPIDAETISYVKRFRPVGSDPRDCESGKQLQCKA